MERMEKRMEKRSCTVTGNGDDDHDNALCCDPQLIHSHSQSLPVTHTRDASTLNTANTQPKI